MAKTKTIYRTRVKHRVRRMGSRIKLHVKAAKPSLGIVGGLAIPAIQVIFGASNQIGTQGKLFFNSGVPVGTELVNRFKAIYLGSQTPSISTAFQSNAVKAAIAGFGIHWIANITGANRYLARMKAPVRI